VLARVSHANQIGFFSNWEYGFNNSDKKHIPIGVDVTSRLSVCPSVLSSVLL